MNCRAAVKGRAALLRITYPCKRLDEVGELSEEALRLCKERVESEQAQSERKELRKQRQALRLEVVLWLRVGPRLAKDLF